jgi:hypothetical protein
LIKGAFNKTSEKILEHYKKYIDKNVNFYKVLRFLDLKSPVMDNMEIKELQKVVPFAQSVSSNELELFKDLKNNVARVPGTVPKYHKFFPDLDKNQDPIISKPLEFWKGDETPPLIYGELKKVAITLFQIPCGSASIERERHFSHHNRIASELRYNLSEENLAMISFIKANIRAVDDFYQVGKFIPN